MATNILTVNKAEAKRKLPDKFVLLCFASFEERSTTVPLSLDVEQIERVIVYKSLSVENQLSLDKICEKIPDCTIVELDLNNPVSTAGRLTSSIKEIISSGEVPLVIDVTTFTHEALTMLLKLIYENRRSFSSVFCLYNGASDYSNSKQDGLKQMWLSKGCRDVRNVVGYPGMLRPVAKTCLIILTGFELERATRLIEILEPDKLALGRGIEPTHDDNQKAMDHFRTELEKWKKNYANSNYTDFDFSCKAVDKAVEVLENLIVANPDDNFIIVPLNTKLSTVAASIVALRNRKVQVCYAVPELYNTQNYSSPSENITIFDLYNYGVFSQ